jgi:predicted homoserine dehydrogenase-like protein
VGGFCTYGLIDNVAASRRPAALPIGLSEGCTLLRDISRDDLISFDDVSSPRERGIEALWREQAAQWSGVGQASLAELAQQ